jgi:TorA maturation chaperone TorD
MTNMDLILQRGDCFKLLAAAFYEPDKNLFLAERLAENLAGLLTACQCPKAATAAAYLRAGLEESTPDELRVEYARLFVGPFALLAPPYGSVYLEQSGRLMGDSTLAVQRLYREAGLVQEIQEAPDHIALELEFLHYLCLKEAEGVAANQPEAAGEYAARQSEFMDRLLRPWLPAFCEKIRRGTENTFYCALADCLESFVAEISQASDAASPLAKLAEPHACRAGL